MKIDFQGKRALVTGAGKGIGREIVLQLIECGARVVAVSRRAGDLISLKEQVDCETIVVDLSDTAMAREPAVAAGPIDLLVNNAGVSIPQPFLDATAEAFDATVAVNVRAAFVVSRIVARHMILSKSGAIVNVSSQPSQVALTDHASYCASKGALDQLTRVMALELGPHGIRVNAANPTVTLTPMGEMARSDPAKSAPMLAKIPLGRFASPRDVSSAVTFLLSDYAAMITGATLPVDGGYLAA